MNILQFTIRLHHITVALLSTHDSVHDESDNYTVRRQLQHNFIAFLFVFYLKEEKKTIHQLLLFVVAAIVTIIYHYCTFSFSEWHSLQTHIAIPLSKLLLSPASLLFIVILYNIMYAFNVCVCVCLNKTTQNIDFSE